MHIDHSPTHVCAACMVVASYIDPGVPCVYQPTFKSSREYSRPELRYYTRMRKIQKFELDNGPENPGTHSMLL